MGKRYLVNLTSGNVYIVIDETVSFLRIERLGDGYTVNVMKDRLDQKYRPVTEEELALIESALPAIDERGSEFRIDEVHGLKQDTSKVGILSRPDARHDFNNIVADQKVLAAVKLALHKVSMRDFLNNTWNLKSIEPMDGKCAINFWGPPGTGKTLMANAVARKLEKRVLQIDYASMLSKWVGDTGKNIRDAFAEAKRLDAVLFFDEADAMLSKRTTMVEDGHSNSINQNRNILMQELDRFNGVVVFATNLFGNYDEALLRRIAHHVEFTLPSDSMRLELFKRHIPAEVPTKKLNFKKLVELSKGFSGGDIKNVCVNAIIEASMDEELTLTQRHLEEALAHVADAKEYHSGRREAKKRSISIAG